MTQITVTIKTVDGGTLTLSEVEDHYILARRSAPNGKPSKLQTIRLQESDMEDIPTLIFAIGRLL
jgi:hypothetical protein